MQIEIKIDCETEDEIFAHLSVIRQELKRLVKKNGGELKVPEHIEDNNCYGTHNVEVYPDCTPEQHFPDGNGFCLSCGVQLGVSIVIS